MTKVYYSVFICHDTVPIWKVPNNTESPSEVYDCNVGGLIMVGKDGWLAEIPYQL